MPRSSNPKGVGKWDLPYRDLPNHHDGIPLNPHHEFLIGATRSDLWYWESWFLERGTPHTVLQLPDGRSAMWRHKWVPDRRNPFDGHFCCEEEG